MSRAISKVIGMYAMDAERLCRRAEVTCSSSEGDGSSRPSTGYDSCTSLASACKRSRADESGLRLWTQPARGATQPVPVGDGYRQANDGCGRRRT